MLGLHLLIEPVEALVNWGLQLLILRGHEIDEVGRACLYTNLSYRGMIQSDRTCSVLNCRSGEESALIADCWLGYGRQLMRRIRLSGHDRRHGCQRDLVQNFAPRRRHVGDFLSWLWSNRYSDVRQASARMVRAGSLSGLLTKGGASATNRFLTSSLLPAPAYGCGSGGLSSRFLVRSSFAT